LDFQHHMKPVPGRELPVCNQTISQLDLASRRESHHKRLRDIASGGRRAALGNRWREGPHKSKPAYGHLQQNLKRQQMQSERYDAIEHENRLLLDKMSALMAPGSSVLDPTAGTWEFSPGVRLNRFQMPVIDHGISHQPTMPQRGAAKLAESLNLGSRRRELERITHENRGIVSRIQGRASQFPRGEILRRSVELDRQLLLLRRPTTSRDLPTPPPTGLGASMPPGYTPGAYGPMDAIAIMRGGSAEAPSRAQRCQSRHLARSARTATPPATTLIHDAEKGHAKLLMGLCPGVSCGATLIVQPGEPNEETVVVEDVWLRRDGLSVSLRLPCEFAHPSGVYIHLYPEVEVHLNRARSHLDGAAHLHGEEVTVRIV